MGLERVAGPGHGATRALWATVFGLYLICQWEPKGGLQQALLATWKNRVGENPSRGEEVRAGGACMDEGYARG